ncbi:MAG: SPASM domain-containing protein, partial [Thermodesulfobacteriota bacterium]|nr:SPASM domain-containing protein [Thermodesulfobacteriota bacterium]
MKRPYGYMGVDLARRLITDISAHGLAEKITLHVMGEPTLHPEFFDILSHAASENVMVGLTTNCRGLGGLIGQRLLDYPLHQIDFSLQTPDEKSFALRNAGGLSFDKYLDGILNFFKNYRHRHGQTTFKFRFLNTRFGCKSMEQKVGSIRVISSTEELRSVFAYWAGRIYDMMGIDDATRDRAISRINRLVSYKWNVVEILPNVFFETYVLGDWGHAFYEGPIRDAWAGYCFGMRDHFAILYNGDVTLCCIDYNGKTAIGNVNRSSLKDILYGEKLGTIMKGFKRFKPVHPYCKFCLGGKDFLSWLTKPVTTIAGLYILKPYFYH